MISLRKCAAYTLLAWASLWLFVGRLFELAAREAIYWAASLSTSAVDDWLSIREGDEEERP